MNLNLGICREEEKIAKKQALIDYMLRHLKVSYFKEIPVCFNLCYFSYFRDTNFMQFVIGSVNSYV